MTTCAEKLQELFQRLKEDRGRGPVNPFGDDVLKCMAMRHGVKAEEDTAYQQWLDRNGRIIRANYSRYRDVYRAYRRNDMRFALKLDAIRAAA